MDFDLRRKTQHYRYTHLILTFLFLTTEFTSLTRDLNNIEYQKNRKKDEYILCRFCSEQQPVESYFSSGGELFIYLRCYLILSITLIKTFFTGDPPYCFTESLGKFQQNMAQRILQLKGQRLTFQFWGHSLNSFKLKQHSNDKL